MWCLGIKAQHKSPTVRNRQILNLTLGFVAGLFLFLQAMNFLGFRIAIEFRPDLVSSLGVVSNLKEHQRIENSYLQNLDQLQRSIDETRQELKNLEFMKNRFMALATPLSLKGNIPKGQDSLGGPYISPFRQNTFATGLSQQALVNDLQLKAEQINEVKFNLQNQQHLWNQQLAWLTALPVGLPIQSEFRFTSGFGTRSDPFTGHLTMHEGLDFSSDMGTPVVSSAPGLVVRSEWDATFGNVVEIKHAENFITRYAHLNKRVVSLNSHVQSGTRIGEVGNTGRSTGPHLHYEIFHNGKAINPALILPLKAL